MKSYHRKTSTTRYYLKEVTTERIILSSSKKRAEETRRSQQAKKKKSTSFLVATSDDDDESENDDGNRDSDGDYTEEVEKTTMCSSRRFRRSQASSRSRSPSPSRGGRLKKLKRLRRLKDVKPVASVCSASSSPSPPPPVLLGRCHICWDDRPLSELTGCTEKHWICSSTCLLGVIETQLESKKTQITCCALLLPLASQATQPPPICNSAYVETQLMLTDIQARRLFQNNAEAAVGGRHRLFCDACPAVMTFDEPIGTITCVCRVIYCLQCKKKAHQGELCNERELRAEKEMLASVRAYFCPRGECRAGPFSHLTACNHMHCSTCTRGHWCAECGVDISELPYAHFCSNTVENPCKKAGCSHCPLYPLKYI